MNCHNVKENLSAFLDGEIEESQATAIKAHLIRCPDCRSERDELEQMGAHIRALQPKTAPPDFEYRIYAGIHTRLSGSRKSRFLQWKTGLASLAAMVTGILIGAWQFQPIVMTPVASRPESAAVEPVIYSTSPVVHDEHGLTEYTIDSYTSPYLTASVSTRDYLGSADHDSEIPELPNASRPTPDRAFEPHYVLDPIPGFASFERTVY